MSRTDSLVAGFLQSGFEFKGTFYRALTAQTLLILEKVRSPFFTGNDEGVRGLLDFLFVASHSAKQVLPLLRDQDAWDLAVLEFAEGFSAGDLEELGALVSESNENVAAAVVEAREEGTKKKPQKKGTGRPT
ncbi:hypothetical protein [Haloferula sp. BvORR071]|uniref:hypothetical protein n=1 Tax=Haloferula sp. BvORR071 TaxID=1396141 RepID=UPI0005540BE6|nr:hypothetical protein [Haloferula sp. BvORR071]